MLDVCLLGTGGMMPLPDRWLTSLLIRYNGRMLLIDCGEGTQIPIKKAGWGFKAIDAILFTHYHADHIAGLPGLLLTIGNSGRDKTLTLMGPPGLAKVVEGLTVISPELPFDLKILELSDSIETNNIINGFVVRSIPVDHAIPCLSYCIEIKRQGKFYADLARSYKIPVSCWSALQMGKILTIDNNIITPEMVIGEERKGIKLSYCTDTRPTERLIEFINASDLFICEGMYSSDYDINKAMSKKHMMFTEAAFLSKSGNVNELWLTHYSPSLINPEEHIDKAKDIFSKTIAGRDMLMKTICFTKDNCQLT